MIPWLFYHAPKFMAYVIVALLLVIAYLLMSCAPVPTQPEPPAARVRHPEPTCTYTYAPDIQEMVMNCPEMYPPGLPPALQASQ